MPNGYPDPVIMTGDDPVVAPRSHTPSLLVAGSDGSTKQLRADDLRNLQITNAAYTMILDYVGGANPIYVCRSLPGTASSAASWQICKLTWNGSNNPTNVQWADGNSNFDNVADNRASLSYS